MALARRNGKVEQRIKLVNCCLDLAVAAVTVSSCSRIRNFFRRILNVTLTSFLVEEVNGNDTDVS